MSDRITIPFATFAGSRDAIGIDFDARNKAIYPARYAEVKRALFGTQPELPGQETFDFAI